MFDISLSVIFPCYNEERNLGDLIAESIPVLNGLVNKYEIIVIDDGSTDNTNKVASKFSNLQNNLRVISHRRNMGYGASLITGFKNSQYDWVFFTDGDNQFYIKEIERLLNAMTQSNNTYGIIAGYRKNRKDPLHRVLYAKAWNWLVNCFFDLGIKDINCAFKLINRKVLENINAKSSGAAINAELLIKSKMAGVRIKQIEVSHRPRLYGQQTGGNFKVVLRAFYELFKLVLTLGRASARIEKGSDRQK